MKLNYCFKTPVDEIFQLETIIKYTKESCLEKEISSTYYNLEKSEQLALSIERNNYINMLSIAEEKLVYIKEYIL